MQQLPTRGARGLRLRATGAPFLGLPRLCGEVFHCCLPNADLSTSSRYKWWVVFMLWWICFFNYADRQGMSAVFPELERAFHFSKSQLGLIGSAFMWVYAGASLISGPICDRFRRRDLILGGCLFWSTVTLMTGWCTSVGQFVTVRALEGLGETFYFPASMSLASDYHPAGTRSRALAWHQSSVYAGTILGSWATAWLAMRYGWRTGFYVFGLAGVGLALCLNRFLQEPVRGASDQQSPAQTGAKVRPLGISDTLRAVFADHSILLLMLAFALANSVAGVFLVWSPTFLKEKFHYNLAIAGLSGTVFIHLASAVSVPLAGWMADHWALRVRGGRVLVQAMGLLFGAAFVFQVGHTTESNTLIASMVCFGLGKGFYDSGIFATLYDTVEPRARGTVVGLMNMVGWGGGALGPWMVGWIADHGRRATAIANMSEAISWGGAIYLMAAALLLVTVWVRNSGSGRLRQLPN